MGRWIRENLDDDFAHTEEFLRAWEKRRKEESESGCDRCGRKHKDYWNVPTESNWPLIICESCSRELDLQW